MYGALIWARHAAAAAGSTSGIAGTGIGIGAIASALFAAATWVAGNYWKNKSEKRTAGTEAERLRLEAAKVDDAESDAFQKRLQNEINRLDARVDLADKKVELAEERADNAEELVRAAQAQNARYIAFILRNGLNPKDAE